MRNLFALLFFLCLTGCSCLTTRLDPEYLAVGFSAISQIESRPYEVPPGKLTYVVSSSIPPKARSVVEAMRKVIPENQVPVSAGISFPKGYFKVDKFEISGNTAVFKGTQGPVYSGNPQSCGRGVILKFRNEYGIWRGSGFQVIIC